MPPWILPAVEMFLKFGLPAAEKFIATWHRKGASKEDWLNLLREVDAMDYDKTIAAAQRRLDEQTGIKT